MKAFLPLDCFFVIRHANSALTQLCCSLSCGAPLGKIKAMQRAAFALSLGSTGFVAESAFCQADSTVTGL